MAQLSPALRKAAILISSLDAPSADALLDQMSESDARKVRDAIMELNEFAPDEQERIIADFLGGSEDEEVASNDEVEFVISSAAAASVVAAPAAPAATPFAFLQEASPETVAKYLNREHPQTIAVVLAHLPPARAAALALALPTATQTEVLLRVGEIDETDAEIVREIERGLEAVLQHELRVQRKRGAGVAALQAILAAAGTSGAAMVRNVAARDEKLAAQLGQATPVVEAPQVSTSKTIFEAERVSAVRPRIANKPIAPLAPPANPEMEFALLAKLDDRSWAKLLRAVDPQLALFALAGAAPELVARLMRQLSPREARGFERRMEQLGPVRLREIEQAQQHIARIAGQMVARGELHLPRPRSFATAV